ncbi:phage tail protein, partial [Elizabethkingia bruuniana]
MGEIVIKKKNTTIDLFNYKPFRSVTKAELSRTLMSDDYVDISVECANPLDLNIGDKVTAEGRTFFLNMLPPVKKLAEDQFSYELRFEGPAFLLRKLKVFNLDSQGNKTTNEFPLTGEINEFLYLLINNANKKDNQWILGSFPSNTETKTLTFNNENCLAVLQRICQEFNVEFDIVEAGGKFTLNIREKIGKTLPFTVEYGMGNGLYDLSRARANDSEVVTVLYAYGSSQNIPVDYRGYSPRLRMPVAVGDYISNQAAIDLFGYVEDVFTPDIKPTFKGKVSGVRSLANGVQEISVSNMDFDLKEKKADRSTKYLIAGTPAKISVTKGDLAGYDFEVVDYIHSTKTFKLKQFADERGQKFPDNTTVFKFAAGDEFTLIDIMMPDQYITNAEQKLYDETVKEYQKVSQNNVKYTLNVDPLFLQDKGEIGIGDLLPIKDADFGIDKASRIISLKKDLLTDTYTSFDVADSYEISLVKEIVNNIKDLQKEIASQKVINRQSYLDGYRRVEDRFSMYFDADGKMDGSHIKADTIDVGMLSSGSKSRWFQLEEVVFTPNLGSDPNSFRATAGRLVHFGIKTSSGAERVWNLSALTVSNLLNQGYYVYAKCDINGDYGTFVITPDRIVFDSQPNYYHFLIGNLYSPSNGFRIFDANYGVSQVNGRQITAGEIASVNRRLIIDLDKGEIIGKVTFTNDSPALGQVQVNIDQSKAESIVASKAYSDAQDNLAKIAAAAYADGIVDAEEARAIADATAKMESAKQHAQILVNNIEIGGRNLILQSKNVPVEMGGGASLQLEAGGFQLTNATEYCKWNTSNVQQGLLIL